MVVRRERVILDLEDNFTAGMMRAAAATKLLDKELGGLDRSTVITHQHVKQFTDDGNGISKMAKQSAIANSEFSDLSARTLILADSLAMLTPAVAPIGAVAIPGIMGLASALGFTVLATGGAVVAFQGVFDALDKLNKAALEPSEANLKAANLAMQTLSPSAQELAMHLQELRPALRGIRDATADGMFPGIDRSLDQFEKLIPMLESIGFTIGDVTGDIAAAGAKSLTTGRWAPFFKFLQDEARPTLVQTAHTVGDLAHGLAELWMAFQPLNRDVGDVLARSAESFDHWATALSQTEGFESFVAYVRENGPHVADALGAIANAVIQILEAMAPLGGPALRILEQLANTLSLIADSPIGPTLLAGVAAMASMRMGARLVDSAIKSGPVQSIKLLSASLKEMQASGGVVAWGQTAKGTERYTEAAKNAKKATMDLVKPGLLVGGLALATSGAAEAMGLMNTASMAMMGFMATGGPWGAAVGGAIGLVLDLASAHKKGEEAARDFADTLDQQTGAITANSRAWVANQLGADYLQSLKDAGLDINELTTALLEGGAAWETYQAKAAGALGENDAEDATASGLSTNDYRSMGGKVNTTSASSEFVDATSKVAGAVDVGKAVFGTYSEAVNGVSGAYQVAQTEALQTVEAMRALRAETLRGENAHLNWKSALLDMRDAVKNNKHTLNENTRAGIENRRVVLDAAAAWNELTDAEKNMPGAARQARKALADTLVAFGMGREAANKYARELLEIPSDVITKAKFSDHDAKAQIESFRRWLQGQNLDKVGHIRMINDSGMGPQVGAGIAGADGLTVPKTGLPYADRHWAFVADGEEIVSNRYGQADRHRSLLKQINANRYGDGGTAGGDRTGGDSIRDLADAAKDSAKAMKEEAKARRDAAKQRRSDAAGTVSGLFTTDPFATDSVWGAVDPIATLNADTAQARLFGRSIKKLRAAGLNGDALASIYSAQDPMSAAAQMAGMSKAQLRKYELAFNRRARVSRETGRFAGTAAYGGGGGDVSGLLQETNSRLRAIETELKTHPGRTGEAFAAAQKTAVRNGTARRKTDGKGSRP